MNTLFRLSFFLSWTLVVFGVLVFIAARVLPQEWWIGLPTPLWLMGAHRVLFWTHIAPAEAIIAGCVLMLVNFRWRRRLKDPPRWYQFTLRELMVVMLLTSLGMSWFAVKRQAAKKQKEAVAALTEHGASVVYDYQVAHRGRDQEATPPPPAWLLTLLGDDFFFNVVGVMPDGAKVSAYKKTTAGDVAYFKALPRLVSLDLADTAITDAGLEQLEGLTLLTTLNLAHTHVTDAGLRHLAPLHKLKELNLAETSITDAGMEHLEGLTLLTKLNLSDTQVTDAALPHLALLRQLEELRLDRTGITDVGLERLQALNRLTKLYLVHTAITDAGLRHLASLRQLQELGLNANQITDAGLKHLQPLAGLRKLELWGTAVTNSGLEHLKGLSNLSCLLLRCTAVTMRGIRELQSSVPSCETDVGLPTLDEPAGDGSEMFALTFAERGNSLLVATGRGSGLVGLAKNRTVRTYKRPDCTVLRAAISADGTRLATVSWDSTTLWEVATGARLREFVQRMDHVTCLALNRDGSQMVVCGTSSSSSAIVWDTRTGKMAFTLSASASSAWTDSAAFSAEGDQLVLVGSGDVVFWQFKKGTTRSLANQISPAAGGTDLATSVAASPAAPCAAIGFESGGVSLVDLRKGALIRALPGNSDAIACLAFSPDGKQVLAGLKNQGAAVLWDTESGKLLRTLKVAETEAPAKVSAVAFSADGKRIATALCTGHVKIWDRETGRLLHVLPARSARE